MKAHPHKYRQKKLHLVYTIAKLTLAVTGSPKYPPMCYHSKVTSCTASLLTLPMLTCLAP